MSIDFSDYPLEDPGHDLIWQARHPYIIETIDSLARRTVMRIDPNESSSLENVSPSFVFAVHGDWGAGKSTFLRFVKRRCEDLVKADTISQEHLITITMNGLTSHDRPPEVELGMRMLEALVVGSTSGARPEVIFGKQHGIRGTDSRSSYRDLQYVVEELIERSKLPEVIDEELSGKGVTAKGSCRTALVLVDELDRCPPAYIDSVLRTILRWSAAGNMTFILAISMTPLIESVRAFESVERSIASPEFVLQKYIQDKIVLPELESNGIARFIASMQLPTLTDPIGQHLVLGVNYFGVALQGARFANPRALKQCIREVYSRVRYDAASSGSGTGTLRRDEGERAVKRAVLGFRWSDFSERVLRPYVDATDGRQKDARIHDAFCRLEAACRVSPGMRFPDSDLSDFEWGRFCDVVLTVADIDTGTMDCERLKDFLSAGIPLCSGGDDPPPPPGGSGPNPQDPTVSSMAASLDESSMEDRIHSLLELNSNNLSQQDRESIRHTFVQCWVINERLYRDGRSQEAAVYVSYMFQLAERFPDVFERSDASYFHDGALTAEAAQEQRLATSMYELALQRQPDSGRYLFNFADHIIKSRDESRYSIAASAVSQLQSGLLGDLDPVEAYLLALRLTEALRSDEGMHDVSSGIMAERFGSPSDEDINDFIANAISSYPPDRSGLMPVMSLLSALQQIDRLRDFVREVTEKAPSRQDEVIFRRALADSLIGTGSEPELREAMDINRDLLASQEEILAENPDDLTRGAFRGVQHNYAILLYRFDYDAEAGRQWFEALKSDPSDPAVQQALARYLVRAGHYEAAQQVVEGHVPSEPTESLLDHRGHQVPDGSFLREMQMGEKDRSPDT